MIARRRAVRDPAGCVRPAATAGTNRVLYVFRGGALRFAGAPTWCCVFATAATTTLR